MNGSVVGGFNCAFLPKLIGWGSLKKKRMGGADGESIVRRKRGPVLFNQEGG